jgi:hypothetical protein
MCIDFSRSSGIERLPAKKLRIVVLNWRKALESGSDFYNWALDKIVSSLHGVRDSVLNSSSLLESKRIFCFKFARCAYDFGCTESLKRSKAFE